ncbi:MAG: DUF768 domain-containing protein [Mesorhizobium sp.]|nr:MAG: DUF768 domain-containing protein [Mesorhizobium sp.]TJW03539.1 MAG: DUF768 domain-containing protein [Mesorhizobium sp.]
MSTRGINFLDKWLAEHLPNAITDDPVAVELIQLPRVSSADEINEEVESVFEVIFEAMQHPGGVWQIDQKEGLTPAKDSGPKSEPTFRWRLLLWWLPPLELIGAREASKASWA